MNMHLLDPLALHPVYEKVLTLSTSQCTGVFTQAARNRQTEELVKQLTNEIGYFVYQFLPRGWDNATTITRASASLNHMVRRSLHGQATRPFRMKLRMTGKSPRGHCMAVSCKNRDPWKQPFLPHA